MIECVVLKLRKMNIKYIKLIYDQECDVTFEEIFPSTTNH